MLDDEEMSDMSQRQTQSQGDFQFELSSSSNSQSQPHAEPWGKIIIYKITRKRLGLSRAYQQYAKTLMRVIELVQEKTTFGRKADINVTDLIDPHKLNEISAKHFSITKKDVNDPICPVFIEDSSTNGTYFKLSKIEQEKQNCQYERIDVKIKRRIIAHKEEIFIEKFPTIGFEFQSYSVVSNNFPDDINKKYHIGKELGRGACGVVNFVQNRKTCEFYALKFTSTENSIDTMLKEVEILKLLKHPCILHLYHVQSFNDSVAIIVDYMEGGDLFSRLQGCRSLSEKLTKYIFYQICCGVEYLHSNNVTHRDLKPENILLATTDKYTLVKVADFGLSKHVNQNSVLQTQCGTPHYLAPEVRTNRPYSNKVDIWSLGVILYNCFTANYPFSEPYVSYNIDDSLRRHRNKWSEATEEAKNIVRECLQLDAKKRPSAKRLITQTNWLSQNDPIVKQALDTMNNPTNKKI